MRREKETDGFQARKRLSKWDFRRQSEAGRCDFHFANRSKHWRKRQRAAFLYLSFRIICADEANVLIQKDTLCWNQVFGARGYYIEAFDAAEGRYRRVKKIKGAV